MMSATDVPAGMVGQVAMSSAAAAVKTDGNDNDENMRHVWKCISIDMSFVKSLYGILEAAECGLSLLALISVSVPKNEGCAYLYSSTYSYFEFVASSCFIVSLVWYILSLLAILKKLGFVRWDIAEIVWLGFFIFNYFISSCVLASHTCSQGGYSAATVFGFICFGVLCAHEFFEIRTFMERRRSSTSGGNSAQGGADDESKY